MNRESIEDLNLEDSKPNEVSQFNYHLNPNAEQARLERRNQEF
jgi:hypothetical protein